MKKKYWLLDADMTLFDFDKAERAAIEAVCARLGVELRRDQIEQYHAINEALWKKLERGEITQERLRVERFEVFLGAMGIRADPVAVAEDFVKQLAKGCYLFPQSLSLLQNLHARCKVAIVTNGITTVQKQRLAGSGLRPYVDALIISQEQGFSKPDARLVEKALEALGCEDRSQAVVVGDSLTSDMAAAKNARVDGIWYNPKGLPRPADNPFIVAEVRQLHELMRYVESGGEENG